MGSLLSSILATILMNMIEVRQNEAIQRMSFYKWNVNIALNTYNQSGHMAVLPNELSAVHRKVKPMCENAKAGISGPSCLNCIQASERFGFVYDVIAADKV
ncbi:unnamed protein product [Echinostoma caproni]|uniref:Transmembrane protein n=1 Tax=Echinostoma caproni TaxID=27848 RepID=A0A183AL32_9TREM|nr:unnamed protein product [Echinostoma caproni]